MVNVKLFYNIYFQTLLFFHTSLSRDRSLGTALSYEKHNFCLISDLESLSYTVEDLMRILISRIGRRALIALFIALELVPKLKVN